VLTRSTDYDTSAEVASGSFCAVLAGTQNGGYQFVQTTMSPTLDSSALVFSVLYAPQTQTLASVTTNGNSTTNSITVGGFTNTGATYSGNIVHITYLNSPYTVPSTATYIYCNASGGAIEVDLPVATASSRNIIINKRDSSNNTVTVKANAVNPDVINGQPTVVINNQYSSVTLHDDAVNDWAVN
jgi:hypothetical protein